MKYSLTQAGNLGQLVSVILLIVGFTKDPGEAQTTAEAIVTTIGAIGYIFSFLSAWIGRYRAGDVTPLGFKKE